MLFLLFHWHPMPVKQLWKIWVKCSHEPNKRLICNDNKTKHIVTFTYLMYHYSDVMMSEMAPQITAIWIVCLTVCSGADHRKCQSTASLAFVGGIHWWPVDSPHKGPVMQTMFPFSSQCPSLFMVCLCLARLCFSTYWYHKHHHIVTICSKLL